MRRSSYNWMMFKLTVKKLVENAHIPQVAHPGDLGADLFSCEETKIPAGGQRMVRTGISLQFPDGWGGVVKDRSSMASARIYTSGGVIDAGYRGELIIIMRNDSEDDFHINVGDKIAQIIPVQAPHWVITESEELSESSRAQSGFGSTGKR